MKTVEVVFRKLWNRKFCKVHRMTPHQTQGIGHEKYPTYVHCSTPDSQIFVHFALRLAVFEIFHILGLPLTPMLKFQSAKFFFIFWQIAKISITLYSPMAAVFIIKFGPDQM